MYSATMIKEVLNFNKKAFDGSFKAVVAVQESTEKMVRVFWEKSIYFPEEGKKAIGGWINNYKNGLDEFRTNMGSRFELIENYLLNAASQMESSFNSVIKQSHPVTPVVDPVLNKVAIDVKNDIPVKPTVKREKISSKKTDK